MENPGLRVLLAAISVALTTCAPAPATVQDRPDSCLGEEWAAFLSPGPQEFEMRERLETDAGEIVAFQFGPLVGEYAKVYLFFLVNDGCQQKAFSVGSYTYTIKYAREIGDIGPEDRLYHLDLYEPDTHSTLDFRFDVPRYEEMRQRALNVLR